MIQSEGDSNQRKPKQTQEFLLRPTVKSVGRRNLFFLVCIYVVTVNQTTHGLGGGKLWETQADIRDQYVNMYTEGLCKECYHDITGSTFAPILT